MLGKYKKKTIRKGKYNKKITCARAREYVCVCVCVCVCKYIVNITFMILL